MQPVERRLRLKEEMWVNVDEHESWSVSLSLSAVFHYDLDSSPPPERPHQMGLMKCCVPSDLYIFFLPDVKLLCHKHISQIKCSFLRPLHVRSFYMQPMVKWVEMQMECVVFTFLHPTPNCALECRCTLSVSTFDKSSVIWLSSLLRAEKAVDKHCCY